MLPYCSNCRCYWLGLLTCKTVSRITYTVLVETLNPAQSNPILLLLLLAEFTFCKLLLCFGLRQLDASCVHHLVQLKLILVINAKSKLITFNYICGDHCAVLSLRVRSRKPRPQFILVAGFYRFSFNDDVNFCCRF